MGATDFKDSAAVAIASITPEEIAREAAVINRLLTYASAARRKSVNAPKCFDYVKCISTLTLITTSVFSSC